MRPFVLTVASILLSSWVTPGVTRDIFVDNVHGDDRAAGRVLQASAGGDGAVRTIGRALRLAGTGDRIVLVPTKKPYRESITLSGSRHSGEAGAPFTIVGNGVVLDGSRSVPPTAWEHYGGNVFRFQPSRVGHQQLFIDGRPAIRVPVANALGEVPKLLPGEWCLHGAYIYFAVDPDKLPADYSLACARETVGITLSHVRNVGIADLSVQGYQLDGINVHNDAQAVTLLRVTCRGNGRSGVAVGGACNVRLDQCLLGDNAEAQLLALPYSTTHVSDSQLLPRTAPAWLNRGGRIFLDGKPVVNQKERSSK